MKSKLSPCVKCVRVLLRVLMLILVAVGRCVVHPSWWRDVRASRASNSTHKTSALTRGVSPRRNSNDSNTYKSNYGCRIGDSIRSWRPLNEKKVIRNTQSMTRITYAYIAISCIGKSSCICCSRLDSVSFIVCVWQVKCSDTVWYLSRMATLGSGLVIYINLTLSIIIKVTASSDRICIYIYSQAFLCKSPAEPTITYLNCANEPQQYSTWAISSLSNVDW